MKRTFFLLAAACSLLIAPLCALAADVKVIANNSVASNSISAGDLKDVFLLDKDSIGGSHVEPVLQGDGAAHEAFLKAYIGRQNAALQAFYRSQVFTGKASMPKMTGGDAEAVAYVAKTKGAIGYVSGGTAAEGVKTLEVK